MKTLRLFFLILIPSWQFFTETVDSPRIEFSSQETELAEPVWQELVFRPQSRSTIEIIKSLFFNPCWNEALFIMDCAEFFIAEGQGFEEKILTRLIIYLKRSKLLPPKARYLRFRLFFISKEREGHFKKDLVFSSELRKIA